MTVPFAWPSGVHRIPEREDWTAAPIDQLATKYDSVERHGWYDNLDPTVAELAALLRDGDVAVDYSGGTGILVGRLLAATPTRTFGIVNVDSSPKFLRLCLEKFRDEPRVAFRLLRYLKPEKRLQLLDEVLDAPHVGRVAALASANAIHLYYDLDETLRSWARCVRPGGVVLVQSGNITPADLGTLLIDDTVRMVAAEARRLVAEEAGFAPYRDAVADVDLMSKHDALRRKFFLPPRPLSFYRDALERAGLRVERVRTQPITARTDEWLDFLRVYHEGILGWVGGSERVEGRAPTSEALRDRFALMERALRNVLRGRETFEATWTYVTARGAH